MGGVSSLNLLENDKLEYMLDWRNMLYNYGK